MTMGGSKSRIEILKLEDVLMTEEEARAEEEMKAMAKTSEQPARPPAAKSKSPAPGRSGIPYNTVVVTCLSLGTLCIISSVLKTWLASPVTFDWFVLAMGVVLCGLSFFRKVAFGASGFEGEMRELLSQIRCLSSSLKGE